MNSVEEIHRSTDPITLTRFIQQERSQFKEATGSFAMLLQSIQLACKIISNMTRKAGIANIYGLAGGQTENSSGDQQKKLDVLSNEVMINCLSFSVREHACTHHTQHHTHTPPLTLTHPIIVREYCIIFDACHTCVCVCV